MAKFNYIGPNRIEIDDEGNEVEVAVRCYTGEMVKNGDTIELNDYLSRKAENNPNYERVKPGPKPKKKADRIDKAIVKVLEEAISQE